MNLIGCSAAPASRIAKDPEDRSASVAGPAFDRPGTVIDAPMAGAGRHRGWSPSPLLRMSIGLHIGASMLAFAEPSTLPWVAGGLIGNHALLGAVGMWPRSRWLGPNITRLPDAAAGRREVALTFDDGPHPVTTPAVLDILESRDARATFFCIGREAAAYPAVVREIVRRGHYVENHSYSHSHFFAAHGVGGLRREVARAQQILADMTGRAPRYFRAPFGLRNPLLEPVLARLGLRLVSWTRRGYDGKESDPRRVMGRLVRGLAPGDILLLHDGTSVKAPGQQAPVVLTVLPLLLDHLATRHLKPVPLSRALGE